MLLSSVVLPLLPPLASASAASGFLSPRSTAPVSERQTWTDNYYENEFSTYGCRPIIFIFARATIEPGNMVSGVLSWGTLGIPWCGPQTHADDKGNTVGPPISNGLKAVFGVMNVATQGVDYLAAPDTNFDPGGAPPYGIGLMQILLSAAAACPNSKILASGYSQGAALTHRAIEGVNPTVKNKIAGVVTFGDTQALQDGGQIRGFDANKTLIICNIGDVVCSGTLIVLPVHLDYVKWVPTALAWLVGTLLAANRTDPWWNGTFLSPSPTPPPLRVGSSDAPSRATDVTSATSVLTVLDPRVSQSGEPRSEAPPCWTTILMFLGAGIFYMLI